MLSCKKASELIEKKSIIPLSTIETIQLHLHKRMCDACSTYEKQSLLIDEMIEKEMADDTGRSIPYLKNEPLKNRISREF